MSKKEIQILVRLRMTLAEPQQNERHEVLPEGKHS